jgi:hypothetical protein
MEDQGAEKRVTAETVRQKVNAYLDKGFGMALSEMLVKDNYGEVNQRMEEQTAIQEEAIFGKLRQGKGVKVYDTVGLLTVLFGSACQEEAWLFSENLKGLGSAMRDPNVAPGTVTNETTSTLKNGMTGLEKAGRALYAAAADPPDVQTVAAFLEEHARELEGGVELVENGSADGLVQNVFPVDDKGTGRFSAEELKGLRVQREVKQAESIQRAKEKVDGYKQLVMALRYPTG